MNDAVSGRTDPFGTGRSDLPLKLNRWRGNRGWNEYLGSGILMPDPDRIDSGPVR
jgi:hypothetical protein